MVTKLYTLPEISKLCHEVLNYHISNGLKGSFKIQVNLHFREVAVFGNTLNHIVVYSLLFNEYITAETVINSLESALPGIEDSYLPF